MKITTLIPAFKPKYLTELLFALTRQTLKPDRVIFSDDSPNGEYTAAFRAEGLKPLLSQLNVDIIPGPRQGGLVNMRNLIKAWNGSTELIHFLFDDDYIYPTFYQRHVQAWQGGNFSCTVSQRWTAIEGGQPVGLLALPQQVAQHAMRTLSLPADALFATTVPFANNWLGELSNAVFDHDYLRLFDSPSMAGISFAGLDDIGVFLDLSLRKPVCYINEPLGFFRMNPQQNTQQTMGRIRKQSFFCWIALAAAGHRLGHLQAQHVVDCARRIGNDALKLYAQEADVAALCAATAGLIAGEATAEERFLLAWDAYVRA